jgi:LPS sulfotransferase NodH
VVTYEDLWQAPVGVTRRILHHLAIPQPARLHMRGWRHQRHADAMADERVASYDARKRALAASSPSGLTGATNA